MFAKLKKKIQDEGGSVSDSERSFPSVPGHASPLRRGSGALVHSPVPKPDTDSGVSSAASPSSQASDNFNDKHEGSKEDMLTMLLKRTDQCEQLKDKLLECNAVIKDKNRNVDKLEKALEKQQDAMSKRAEEYQTSQSKLSTVVSAAVKKKEEEMQQLVSEVIKENEELNTKLDGLKEKTDILHEPASRKSFLKAQEELVECKSQLAEKVEKLKLSENSVKYLGNEVTKLQEKVKGLDTQCLQLNEEAGNHGDALSKMTNQKAALEQTVESTNADIIQKNTRLSTLESSFTDLEGQHATLLRNSEIHRNKTNKLLEEKDEHIRHLQDRVHTLEQRLQDNSLSGDERIDAFRSERTDLENKLSETRQQLTEIKTSWSNKITHLEEQISHLNIKIVEDSEEMSNSEKNNEQMRENFHHQIEIMKKKVENAEKRLYEKMELSSSNDTHYEKEKHQWNTELSNLKLERVDLETQLRSKISSLESQLLSLETAKDHEKGLSDQRISQLQEREQEYIDNELMMEKKIEDYEDELGHLKTHISKKSQECVQLMGKLTGSSALEEELYVKISSLEGLVESSEGKSDMHQKSSKALQHDLQDCSTEKDKLLLRNAELSQQITSLQSQSQGDRNDLERQLEDRMQELDLAKQTSDKLHSQLEQHEKKIEELEKSHQLNASDSLTVTQLQQQVSGLQEQLTEKNKFMKKQELRLTDLKKTLQRELRVQSLPNDEPCEARVQSSTPPIHRNSPSMKMSPQQVRKTSRTPSPTHFLSVAHKDFGATNTITWTKDNSLENATNFQYLKHVVLKFMLSRESEAVQLIRAVAVLLKFTEEEQELIKETLEYKMSWFGVRPTVGKGQHARIVPSSY